jgi:uncharacterized membrane protein
MDVAAIFICWLLFGGTHIIGSSLPVRSYLIGKFGALAFKGIYSLIAFATFIPLCMVYAAHKHAGPLLYIPNTIHSSLAQLLMLLALIVLLQGLLIFNPQSVQAELSGRIRAEPRGIERLCRHPQNLSFFLFGGAHMLANPFVGDWLFFGGFVIYSLLSAVHQDRRNLGCGTDEIKTFIAATSLLPFAAINSGRQKIDWGEFSRPGLLIATLLFILLRFYHQELFGGFGR